MLYKILTDPNVTERLTTGTMGSQQSIGSVIPFVSSASCVIFILPKHVAAGRELCVQLFYIDAPHFGIT